MFLKNISPYTFAGLLFIASACGNKNQQAASGPPPVQVAVLEVKNSDAVYYDEYPAIIRALNEVELRAQVNGYITAIHFKEGEKVRKGQNYIRSISNNLKLLISRHWRIFRCRKPTY